MAGISRARRRRSRSTIHSALENSSDTRRRVRWMRRSLAGLGSTVNMFVGLPVSGPGIPGAATIASVDSSSQVTLSVNATATANVALTFGTATPVGFQAAVVILDGYGPMDRWACPEGDIWTPGAPGSWAVAGAA